MPLALRALLPEVVAREGVPGKELALGGLLEALLGAGVSLHLRHANALLKQTGSALSGGGLRVGLGLLGGFGAGRAWLLVRVLLRPALRGREQHRHVAAVLLG